MFVLSCLVVRQLLEIKQIIYSPYFSTSDEELAKKRVRQQLDSRTARARLRQINLEIEEAARYLRRCKLEEKLVKGRAEMVEDKHWAVLSLYDADKASQEVSQTLQGLGDDP